MWSGLVLGFAIQGSEYDHGLGLEGFIGGCSFEGFGVVLRFSNPRFGCWNFLPE